MGDEIVLKRRQFLLALASVPVAGATINLPATVDVDPFPGFDPDAQYGNWVLLNEDVFQMDRAVLSKVVEVLEMDVRRSLPQGVEFGIILKGPSQDGTPDPFSDVSVAAWRYPYREGDHLCLVT